MNREFLKEMLNTPSVSGYEEQMGEKLLAYGREFAEEQLTDPSGNAISVVNPQAENKILLCGHMDEIGFVVTHIDDEGWLRLTAAGGVRPKLYIGSPVEVWHQGNKVNGVIATSSELLGKDKVKDSDLLVDIGACSKEEAAERVSVGDPVCADAQVRELLNDCFSGRALDDRTGAFVVAEAARRAKLMGAGMGIYAAATTGEETSGRGAYYAAVRIKPDCAIAVDVTAAELGMAVQWEVATGRTGTDGDTVNKAFQGIPMALVSIPLRYMHSSVEVGSWKDIEQCIELLAAFLVRLDKEMGQGFDFCSLRI